MSALSSFFAFFARIFLAVLFVVSGYLKLTDFSGSIQYVASTSNLPMPQVFTALTILVELGGGILLILGLFARTAAFIMAGFALLTILLVHHFWNIPLPDPDMNQLHAMKNLSIAGGLLMITAFGPGAWAIGPGGRR